MSFLSVLITSWMLAGDFPASELSVGRTVAFNSLKMMYTTQPTAQLLIPVSLMISNIHTSLPISIVPTSKTTTINDPTAGMSEEEITNYISNVGGDLCGSSDFVRSIIGISLNLSLILFGVFTLGYCKYQ